MPCVEKPELVAKRNAGLVGLVWDPVSETCFGVCMGPVLPATLNYIGWDSSQRQIELSYSDPHTARASAAVNKILLAILPMESKTSAFCLSLRGGECLLLWRVTDGGGGW